tara:strand:+ start:171 stop:488 length:318 start_codon:yes stop_codon:yes gene_type:complete
MVKQKQRDTWKQEQRDTWKEVTEIWENSSKGKKINFQISELISELKEVWDKQVSPFEKSSITSDITKIKSSWNKDFAPKISQFEKDSISKGLLKITKWIKKFLKN